MISAAELSKRLYEASRYSLGSDFEAAITTGYANREAMKVYTVTVMGKLYSIWATWESAAAEAARLELEGLSPFVEAIEVQ
jgi:hypothetical protein